jgi:hypothetical protein
VTDAEVEEILKLVDRNRLLRDERMARVFASILPKNNKSDRIPR